MAECPITERKKNYKKCKICKYHHEGDGCVYWEWSGEYDSHSTRKRTEREARIEDDERRK